MFHNKSSWSLGANISIIRVTLQTEFKSYVKCLFNTGYSYTEKLDNLYRKHSTLKPFKNKTSLLKLWRPPLQHVRQQHSWFKRTIHLCTCTRVVPLWLNHFSDHLLSILLNFYCSKYVLSTERLVDVVRLNNSLTTVCAPINTLLDTNWVCRIYE